MRTLIAIFFLLAAALPGLGQTSASAGPVLPKEPAEILAAAAPFYDFTSANLKPWHLKATYQLYDEKGKPAEQGTYEYWWASPKVRRSSWTRADATRTEWWTADGAQYRKESGKPLRYFERSLDSILLSPLPDRSVLDSGRMKLELKMLPAGQEHLACISAALQWLVDGKLQAPGSATPQYYCFDPSLPALRMTYSNSITTEYNRIVKAQSHYLAREVVVSAGKHRIFSISVETIDGINASDALLIPTADAVLARTAASQTSSGQTGNDVALGSLVKKTQPVYPMVAKMAHEQGVVVLGAVIGADGRIHDLEVLASPSPLLAASALDAVKRWEYKPYLLNGVAVEVETVVNVIFALGG
jgi:TonB family protein